MEKHVEAVNSMLKEQDDDTSSASEIMVPEAAEWNGIIEQESVDHENEYVDEDRFTTVTVEAVNVEKDGLHRAKEEGEDDSDGTDAGRLENGPSEESLRQGRPNSGKPKRIWTKELPKGSKKKKKFHYESKAERKATRYKERSGNKAKAKARRA